MNLVIDQGNTVVKVAVFDQDIPVSISHLEILDMSKCRAVFEQYKIKSCIYSSVSAVSSSLVSFIKENCDTFLFVDHLVKLPIENCYKTPETLGMDRLAAVVGANDLFPEHNVLIIDVGTAMTFDFIDQKAVYHGGSISPGISMRFKALNFFTDKLPLITRYGDTPEVGYDTETAIRSGVLKGVIYEINAYIEDYKLRYKNIQVILTGGHSDYVITKLKNHIFVDQNLVLRGLNRILRYNV